MLKNLAITTAKLQPVGRHCLLTNKIRNAFSSNPASQTYKPLMPLTQRHNPIYIHNKFVEGKTLKPASIFLYWLPAGLVLVNNFLTEWNMWNSLLFGSLLLGSFIVRMLSRNAQGLIIHCLQVDPQIKYLYITVPSSISNYSISRTFPIPNNQIDNVINDYHPLKQKYPGVVIKNDMYDFCVSNKDKHYDIKTYQQVIGIQGRVQRFKIPIQDAQFVLKINPRDLPQFQRDKERLSQKELFKKYENQNIQLLIKIPDQEKSQQFKLNDQSDMIIKLQGNEKFPYQIILSQNAHKRYHDYLLALALGYKIDTTDNIVIIKQTKQKQQVPSKQSQKQNSQEKKDDNTKK